MQTFRLLRHKDVSGVSGEGYVAEGWITSYGECFMRWYGTGFSFFNSVEDMLRVHGHGGQTETEVIWGDGVVIQKGEKHAVPKPVKKERDQLL